MRINPNRKNQKSPKNQERQISHLPLEIRQRGIATQRELVMALLPYMEWVKYEDLVTKFWKYVDHHSDGPLRANLYHLHKEGLVEKKYEGSPPARNGTIKLTPYLYVRRVSKTCPRKMNKNTAQKRLDGTFGIEAQKERARMAAAGPKKPPKFTNKNLTMDDVKYIRDNPHGMNTREAAEAFQIHTSDVQKIRNGHIPSHLKERPAQ